MAGNAFTRVWGMCFAPTHEWDLIDGERASTQGLLLGYAGVLAALPILADVAGRRLFSFGVYEHGHPPLAPALIIAAITWIITLLSVLALAKMIEAMAGDFGGEANWIPALKVAVYTSTIGWVTGLVGLFPPLAIVGGLCAILEGYPLYVGLPKLMKASHERAMAYTLPVFVVAMLMLFVVRFASGWAADLVMIAYRR